jgi:hypothetical protein
MKNNVILHKKVYTKYFTLIFVNKKTLEEIFLQRFSNFNIFINFYLYILRTTTQLKFDLILIKFFSI